MWKLNRRVVVAVLVLAGGVALATSPHFINANVTLESDGSLVFTWKEAGLGANQNIVYLASATANEVCTCVNNSGSCPKAANKVATSGDVSASGSFSSGKNGSINGTLTVEPVPCPPSDPPTCGHGQQLVVSSITYTNISLTDTTNHIVAPGLPSSRIRSSPARELRVDPAVFVEAIPQARAEAAIRDDGSASARAWLAHVTELRA
jgi:hypothetical protein